MQRWFIISCALCVIALNAWLYGVARTTDSRIPTQHTESVDIGLHYAAYMNPEFYTGYTRAEQVDAITEQVYGGIVSHHFYMEKQITDFFDALRTQQPSVVVIIGPNHFQVGNAGILVSEYGYNTPWGVLQPDTTILQQLKNAGVVATEEKPFEREHSITTLVGFIKKTFPNTHVVPIMIKRTASIDDAIALGETLDKLLPENSLVIGSVDFSHHQNRIVADFHDEKSISAIQSFDFSSISNLEIDSPQSIAVILTYLKKRGAQHMAYTHTNAAEVGHIMALEDVTSYVFANFTKGEPLLDNRVSFLSFGDMMFDRAVGDFIARGNDPFEQIQGVEGNFLRGIDVITANLEGPITTSTNCQQKDYSFAFPPSTVSLLRKHSISLVSIANNHSYDCYEQGFLDTQTYLSAGNIGYFGNRDAEKSYVIKQVGNHSIAFIGIDSFSTHSYEPFYTVIDRLAAENDFVVATIHWGVEYMSTPNNEQRTIAHELIDHGARVIIGHHPHVMQSMEVYKNAPIFYSLGNAIFDQDFSSETTHGLAVGSVLGGAENSFYLFPYVIKNFSPELLLYPEAEKFCKGFIVGVEARDTCAFSIPTD